MSKMKWQIKYQMSNVNRVKLLSERTSGVPTVIFFVATTNLKWLVYVFRKTEYVKVSLQ